MELPQPEDRTLTWGDLCAALADGTLPSRKDGDYSIVRALDIHRLQRSESSKALTLNRWLEAVRSDPGVFA